MTSQWQQDWGSENQQWHCFVSPIYFLLFLCGFQTVRSGNTGFCFTKLQQNCKALALERRASKQETLRQMEQSDGMNSWGECSRGKRNNEYGKKYGNHSCHSCFYKNKAGRANCLRSLPWAQIQREELRRQLCREVWYHADGWSWRVSVIRERLEIGHFQSSQLENELRWMLGPREKYNLLVRYSAMAQISHHRKTWSEIILIPNVNQLKIEIKS